MSNIGYGSVDQGILASFFHNFCEGIGLYSTIARGLNLCSTILMGLICTELLREDWVVPTLILFLIPRLEDPPEVYHHVVDITQLLAPSLI